MEKEKIIENSAENCGALLQNIKAGDIVIPNFQRGYVWNKQKIIDFLNSLIKNEPFGTMLLWSPGYDLEIGTKNEIIKSISKEQDKSNVKYLIDGQQRATSLLIICNSQEIKTKIEIKYEDSPKPKPTGWNYGQSIYFDYMKEIFILDKDTKSKISLDDMFLLNSTKDFKNYFKLNNVDFSNDEKFHDYVDNIRDVKKYIQKFEISQIILKNHNLDDVIKIFSNINTKGTTLTSFNLIHAKWSILSLTSDTKESDFDFEKELKKKTEQFMHGYKKIHEDIFVDSLYLNIGDDPIISSEDKIKVEIEKDNSTNLINKFYKNLKAFESTYDFLIKKMKMELKFLPSKIIYQWLTYYFFNKKNKIIRQEVDVIQEYIRLSCINKRYSKNTGAMLLKDISFVDEVLLKDSDVMKEWKIWKEKYGEVYFEKEKLTINDLNNIDHSSTSMVCKYIKYHLASTTRSFFGGSYLWGEEKIDFHHIFPVKSKIVKGKISKERYNNICNSTPLTKDDNQNIGNKNPSIYLTELKNDGTIKIDEILKEHKIEKQYLENDDFDGFMENRAISLLALINNKFDK